LNPIGKTKGKKVIVVEETQEEQQIPKSNKDIKKKRVSSIEQDKSEIVIVKEEKDVDEEKIEVKKQRNKKKVEEKTNFNQENTIEIKREEPSIAKKESKQRNQVKIKEEEVEEINTEKPKKETKVPEKIIVSNEKPSELADWNAKMNARNKSERKKPRDENQIIEIEADESKERGKSLSEAFKNRKSKLIKNMDKRQEEIKTNVSNSNQNKGDGEENKSIDLKNESTAIGDTQIFNETKIYNNENANNKKKEMNKNKKKLEEIKEYPSKNEPSKELLDRLIYGKKAELNEKEIKDVNKRLYSKLIEKKDKKKNEDFDKKRELKTKNKEKLKEYSEKLQKDIINKQAEN